MTLANIQNSWSTLAPASIDKSACSPAGIMSPGLGPAELLRNCLLDWAPSGANKKLPPGLGPGSFLKKLQWGAVFLCQIEYGTAGTNPAVRCIAVQGISKFVPKHWSYVETGHTLPRVQARVNPSHLPRVRPLQQYEPLFVEKKLFECKITIEFAWISP